MNLLMNLYLLNSDKEAEISISYNSNRSRDGRWGIKSHCSKRFSLLNVAEYNINSCNFIILTECSILIVITLLFTCDFGVFYSKCFLCACALIVFLLPHGVLRFKYNSHIPFFPVHL